MIRDDYNYYARRARQEDEAAANAGCDSARELHDELANAYRFRCELIRQLPAETVPRVAIDQPIKNREPIGRANTIVLATSQATAARPFCRA